MQDFKYYGNDKWRWANIYTYIKYNTIGYVFLGHMNNHFQTFVSNSTYILRMQIWINLTYDTTSLWQFLFLNLVTIWLNCWVMKINSTTLICSQYCKFLFLISNIFPLIPKLTCKLAQYIMEFHNQILGILYSKNWKTSRHDLKRMFKYKNCLIFWI